MKIKQTPVLSDQEVIHIRESSVLTALDDWTQEATWEGNENKTCVFRRRGEHSVCREVGGSGCFSVCIPLTVEAVPEMLDACGGGR